MRQNPLPLVRERGLKALYGSPAIGVQAHALLWSKKQKVRQNPRQNGPKNKSVPEPPSSILGRLRGVRQRCARASPGAKKGAEGCIKCGPKMVQKTTSAPEPPWSARPNLAPVAPKVVQKWSKKQKVRQNPHCLYYYHSILLHNLSYYGIRGTSLNWFTSYLSNRTPRIPSRPVVVFFVY